MIHRFVPVKGCEELSAWGPGARGAGARKKEPVIRARTWSCREVGGDRDALALHLRHDRGQRLRNLLWRGRLC